MARNRTNLTATFIKSGKLVPARGAVDYRDPDVQGLALRVTQFGHKSYVLIARYPLNPKNPTRRVLGDTDEMTLAEARDAARAWRALIRQGIDPKVQAARERAELQRQQANTFAAVAEEFLSRHAATLATAKEARRLIEAEFVKRWGERPVTEITPEEAAAVIRGIAKQRQALAHNALGYLRRLYSWAIGTHEFGVESSPVERFKPADLIGKRVIRERILTDDELRRVWDAAGQIGYPFGHVVKLLILTGQRLTEISALSWMEINAGKRPRSPKPPTDVASGCGALALEGGRRSGFVATGRAIYSGAWNGCI